MAEFTLVSFNTHYGLLPLRDDCGPYDLFGALAGLGEPDVFVDPGGLAARRSSRGRRRVRRRPRLRASRSRARAPRPSRSGGRTSPSTARARSASRSSPASPRATSQHSGSARRSATTSHSGVRSTSSSTSTARRRSRRRPPHVSPAPRPADPAAPPRPRAARRPTGPTIVAGDCNFWGPPVQRMLPGFRRAVRGRTWPAPRPHSQIDHVLLRGGLDVDAAEVLGPVGSDHRPVRVRLRIR